jgi:hypothetical protein
MAGFPGSLFPWNRSGMSGRISFLVPRSVYGGRNHDSSDSLPLTNLTTWSKNSKTKDIASPKKQRVTMPETLLSGLFAQATKVHCFSG